MKIEKFSIGVGDRFGHQGAAQLSAFIAAKKKGVSIVPVWNKSKREHTLIGSSPADTRKEADAAVKKLGWKDSYYVDADHIGLKNVDDFIAYSNFFTLDVADFIGLQPSGEDVKVFLKKASKYIGTLTIPHVSESYKITEEKLKSFAGRYLVAIKEAGKIYNHIKSAKDFDKFVTEVSVDENKDPQTPEELFFILLGLAGEKIPVQTIAPKFTGRFNKGIDYVGDIKQFTKEFEDDINVIKFAVKEFGLPENLKLSVHSGSDKFSLYKPIGNAIKKFDAGLHLKTAGTTWLEELIGLAEADGEGLEISKTIYEKAFNRLEEMVKPYATVVDIDVKKLPLPADVWKWSSKKFVDTLRHDQKNSEFNIHFRQLLHLAYKIAAELGSKYINALEKYEDTVAKNVTENIFDRHIKPLFLS
jgi:hypothetical protein